MSVLPAGNAAEAPPEGTAMVTPPSESISEPSAVVSICAVYAMSRPVAPLTASRIASTAAVVPCAFASG